MDIIKAQSCRNLSSTNRPASSSLYEGMRHHNQMSMVRGFPRNLERSCLWEIRDSTSSSNSESECIREEMRWGVNVGGRGSGRRDGAGEGIRNSVLWWIQVFPLTRDHGSSALNRDPALGFWKSSGGGCPERGLRVCWWRQRMRSGRRRRSRFYVPT